MSQGEVESASELVVEESVSAAMLVVSGAIVVLV
jgi:hypothetical protein